MKIKYLNRFFKLYKENDWLKYGGVSIEEILNLEKKSNITFPISYKEFFLIDGKDCPIMGSFGYRFEFTRRINDEAQENLKKYNVILEKDIWVVAELDNSMFVLFFLFR